MRKIKHLFILLLLMIIFPSDVLGDLSVDTKHILTMEKINVNNSKITFEGYSFISHMDNWGIDSNGYGNLKNYIVAYVRSEEENFFTSNTISESANTYTFDVFDFGKCLDSNACIYQETDVVEGRSFFYSRCTDEGCGLYDIIKTDRKERGFINDNKCSLNKQLYDENGKLSSSSYDNECLYENVGFSTTVDIQNVVDIFSEGGFRINYGSDDDDDDIVFKIVVVNTKINKNIASGFNIHQSACFVNEKSCSGTNVTSSSYNFTFSDFANQVFFDAKLSIPTKYDKDKGFSNLKNYYFVAGEDYYLKNYYTNLKKVKGYYTCAGAGHSSDDGHSAKEHYCGEYTDSFVELYTEMGSDGYLHRGSTSSAQLYLAPANHVTLKGEFAIDSFNLLAKPLNCDDIRNISGDNYSEKSITCENDAEFSQCSVSGENGNSIIGEMYYLDENYNAECSGTNYVEDVNGNHYLKVKVMADVLIYQTGRFQFGSFSPNVVRAGKGFSIGNSGISYSNFTGFIIAGKYNNPVDTIFYNTPFIDYSAVKYKKITLGERTICGIDTSFSIDEKIREYYSEHDANGNPMKESSPFYYKKCDTESNCSFEKGNSLEAAINAISDAFFSTKVVNYDNNKDNDVEMNDIFKFESYDSNSSNTYFSNDDKVNVDGIWTKTEYKSGWTRLDSLNNLFYNDNGVSPNDNGKYRGFGKKFESVYTYNLPYAYVALNDMTYDSKKYKYADIVYTTSPISNPSGFNLQGVGNKYFVGSKYASNNPIVNGFNFPFDLSSSNISFVSNMPWYLSGTCGVNVEDGWFEDGQFLYKYRPISLNKPFPKAEVDAFGKLRNVATNWVDWYNDASNNNFSRFVNTYNNGIKYSIILSKNSNSENTKVSDVNKFNIFYGSIDEMNVNGQSDFVNGFNEYKDIIKFNVKESFILDRLGFCPFGYFSKNCDNYVKTNIGLN